MNGLLPRLLSVPSSVPYPQEELHLEEFVPESFENLGDIFRRVFGC
jgi:hypothetical protein